MKRIGFILLVFFMFISCIKAETIIDNYKVEVVVEDTGVLDIKESFKVVSLDDSNKVFWKVKLSSTYDYDTNVNNFDDSVYLMYVDYLNFSLEEGKEYYLSYKKKTSDYYSYYDFLPITENYDDLESILYKNFYLIARANNTLLDKNDIYNYSNMVVSLDDNVLTGIIEDETRSLDSFEIRFRTNSYVTYDETSETSSYFNRDITDQDLNYYYMMLTKIPIGILIINILIALFVFVRKKTEIDDTPNKEMPIYNSIINKPNKPICRLMILLVVASYLVSLSSTAILTKNYAIILGVVLLMGFYSLFYNAAFFQMRNDGGVGASKIFLYLTRLFVLAFVFFHSSCFACLVLGVEPFTWTEISKFFWIGFLVNALNLEIISLLKR